MARRRLTLDEILAEVVRTRNPKVLKNLHSILNIEEAEEFCSRLRPEMDIQPYDFPGTIGVWQTVNGDYPYSLMAAKQLIVRLAEESGVEYATYEGFKSLLPLFSAELFNTHPINEWGTTLGGMLRSAYQNSPSSAILDLIRNDDDFEEIRRHNLQAYDFSWVPMNTWVDEGGNPSDTARATTKQLIKTLAKTKGVDYTTFEGFKSLMPSFTQYTFNVSPINDWGTTLSGMIRDAYEGSPSAAVLDLVHNDEEFDVVRRHNLQTYDFPCAPNNTWIDKNGVPTDTTRAATKKLIKTLAETEGVDYTTFEGFKSLMPYFTVGIFHTFHINEWGTTLVGMCSQAYNNSPSAAILDLVHNDGEFDEIRKHNLQLYDFPITPNSVWIDEEGNPTDIARAATKQLIKTLAENNGVDRTTTPGLRSLMPYLNTIAFTKYPINEWGTTLYGMLTSCYSNSPSAAINDLAEHDESIRRALEYAA